MTEWSDEHQAICHALVEGDYPRPDDVRNADIAEVIVSSSWLKEHDARVRAETLDLAASIAFKRSGGYETGIDLLALKQEPSSNEPRGA